MRFDGLQQGVLERRYKRFLADVRLPDGRVVTAHCPNTGAMTGCAEPGWDVWLSPSRNPKRKLEWTLELVNTDTGLVCVHSTLANKVVAQAIDAGALAPLAGYSQCRAEVRYGEGSRADFCLSDDEHRCMVEVKAVTWHVGGGVGRFPDAVSERARKHLQELTRVVASGERAVLLFCVLHNGIQQVEPARQIDAAYADALATAVEAGVEVLALATRTTVDAIEAEGLLPVVLT